MAPESRVFVTGPDVVRSVTGEDVDMATLGGPDAHHKKSGVCHIVADDELDAYARGRKLVGFFCQQGVFDRGRAEADHTDLRALLPESAKRAYDVHPIVNALLDGDDPFEEFQGKWAPSMVIGLGRLAGRTVGVLANNPLRLGGCLNSESAEKAARFVRLCNAFGIPLIVLVDVPGYLPGVGQEWGGVVRRGAKLLHAFGEATVPRVTLVTRKIYGGAYIAMNSRSLGATKVFAWPDAEVAVMGAKAAVGILHKKQLAAAAPEEREALHEELALEHERIAGGVDRAIEIGVVDEEIEPSQTRAVLTRALAEAPRAAAVTRTSRCRPCMSEHRRTSISVDGHRLAYRQFGSGDRVVVLSHAFLTSHYLEHAWAQELAARGFRVICLDLLGTTADERPLEPDRYNSQALGRQLIGALDALGIERAVLGGTSVGANISIEAAALAPERVAGLLLRGPSWSTASVPPDICGRPGSRCSLWAVRSCGWPVRWPARSRRPNNPPWA